VRLIYLSPVPWHSHEQRPHAMVRDFLAQGGDSAIWIDPYPARLPRWDDLVRPDLRETPMVVPLPPGLRVLRPGGWPIDPLPAGSWINRKIFWQGHLRELVRASTAANTIVGIGRPTAPALHALAAIPCRWTFYDAMDDFPEFYRGRSRAATQRIEAAIAARVATIFASSSSLVRKFATAGRPATLLPNAYDMALLPPVSPRPSMPLHLGYIGYRGAWFDWALVAAIARAIAPAPVTLVGPQSTRTPRALPANVHLRPACSAADSAAFMREISAGLIPFVVNSLTAAVDPIKFYQYRGAGLPVLSTRFGDMAARTIDDGVFFVGDDGVLGETIAVAHRHRSSGETIQAFRDANSWTARFRAAGLWDVGAT
jgi:hypothetical protein